jgi:polyhydroxyalkanoate synthesis regulator phasin
MGFPSSKREEGHSFRNALVAAGEMNEDDNKAAFKDWKTDIHSVMLTEWRAQSKKRLHQWMLQERESRHEAEDPTTNHQ